MRNTKRLFFLLHATLATSLLFFAPPHAASLGEAEPRGSNHGGDGTDSSGFSKVGSSGWQVLTRRNFSSQICLHPHVLVMVTVPWSGESRSLMKEVSRVVANNQQLFGYLKLMVVYKNSEKKLADVLGATEEVALLYYHHSKSFRYRGRLRAQSILFSVSHVMSFGLVEFPLKFLDTVEELENFFQSTDKAVLLLEFCGWSTKLLRAMNNGTEECSFNVPGLLHHGDTHVDFTNEADETPIGRKENQKGSENEKLTCGIENELSGAPWLGDFSMANETALKIEARKSNFGTACSLDKLQQFESVFSEFSKIAREFSLPPQRQGFGVISERSLLPFLDPRHLETWMLLIHFSGFPNSTKILEDVNDLRISLEKDHSAILEVERDQRNQEGAFPASGPSIILFIDRSSDSPQIREESKTAIEVYRLLAHHYQLPNQIFRDEGNGQPKISSMLAFQDRQYKGPLGSHGHTMTKGSSTSRIVKGRDKVSFTIVNEGESISQDNPAYDILQRLLQREDSAVKTKEVKISLLAKEVGFQLLSDDFDVQIIDLLPSHQGDPLTSTGDGIIGKPDYEILQHPLEANVNVHSDDSADEAGVAVAVAADGKESERIPIRSVLQWTPEQVPSVKSDTSLSSMGSYQESSKDNIQLLKSTGADSGLSYSGPVELSPLTSHAERDFDLKQYSHGDEGPTDNVGHTDCILNYSCDHEVAHMSTQRSVVESSMQSDITKEEYSIGAGNSKEQHIYRRAFTGSFFFSDGGYRLLTSLTGGMEIPAVVILDPILHRHYVLPNDKDFCFDSLVDFVDKFLNGSLSPYQRSEPVIQSPRETPQPPFVNLDFHEADGIPRVTANTFSELVLSSTYCDNGDRMPSSKDKEYVCTWKGDVLVLFSNRWCGFCQRMELVVREVYRAFKNFRSLSSDSTYRVFMPLRDKLDGSVHDFPSIYHMDCTLNGCSSFLRKYGKGEVYPSLILFQAENKDAITYDGDMSVLGIFEFLANHGSNSHNLNEYKGILWNQAPKGHGSGEPSNVASPVTLHDQALPTKDHEYRDSPLDDREDRGNHQPPVEENLFSYYPAEGERVAVGSVLTATDKLLNASPFDKSSILIVKADQNDGFLGLILNKHINWDVFEKLDENLAPLKQAPVSFGGPVRTHDLPLLSLARKRINAGYSKVASNIYFGLPLATAVAIERIRTHNDSASDFWFFLGCSSWGWNQLFDELAEGAWQVSVLNVEDFEWPRV